jgi:hypothetical protein
MTHLRFHRAAPAGRFTLLLAAVLLAGCTQTKLVDSWQAEEKVSHKPTKVAVIAVLPEALARESVERDVAKILADKGTPAVPASRLPGMGGGIRGEIDTEVATGLLRKAGVEARHVLCRRRPNRDAERSNYWAEYLEPAGYSWARPLSWTFIAHRALTSSLRADCLRRIHYLT